MKTDLIEIFQSIRANLQPYSALGYTVHENSESGYDLYSEKNISVNGEQITERFFAGVYISGDQVQVRINTEELDRAHQNLQQFDDDKAGFAISELDDAQLKEIGVLIEIVHNNFKEKEWV